MVTNNYFNRICGGYMKILFSTFTILCLFLFNSCSNNSGNPTGAGGVGGVGGGGGGGGGGSVTFGITKGPGTTATSTFFYGTPSAAVTITTYTISLPAQPLTDNYTPPDPTKVYPASQAQNLAEYNGVATGQKWVFVFTGHLGTATGTAFTATSNYTVP
jgi:hypothetical protein